MPHPTIVFLGAGNMAGSLIGSLISNGHPASALRAVDPDSAQREAVTQRFAVATFGDANEALPGADIVVLAVKPQMMADVIVACAPALRAAAPLLISVAAGVRAADICRWLGTEAPLVRAMPNTPALLGCGATGLYATEAVDETQRRQAESILSAAGITEWVAEESLLDAVTGVSGSGPAYYFLLMELMENAARELGLPADTARRLVLHTALGAARMALESGEPPAVLRTRVTSPKGTTERALDIFHEGDIEALVMRAVRGARDRAVELGDSLGAR